MVSKYSNFFLKYRYRDKIQLFCLQFQRRTASAYGVEKTFKVIEAYGLADVVFVQIIKTLALKYLV